MLGFIPCALAEPAKQDIPPIPDSLKSAGGMIVDNYDQGNFFFTFQDKLGSTIQATTVQHSAGPYFRYLRMQYNLHGGYVGIWSKIGMRWSGKGQDWSKAQALTFLAYTDHPAEIQFTFKLDERRKVIAHAKLDSPGKWVSVTIPTKDWENIGVGLGTFSEFLLNINTQGQGGAGVIGIDELRVIGAGIPTQETEKIELDPKVIFAKSLVPPAARSRKTYFISPTGDDRAAGDADHPFSTIQHAADIVLPGDTVLIVSGTYRQKDVILISHGGAPDAWVTFAAPPGAHPIIDAPTPWTVIDVRNTAYVELRGLEVTAAPNPVPAGKNEGHNGISGNYSHHLRFIDCVVHDCDGGGIGTGYCDYVTIENCRAYNNAYHNIWNCSGISLWEGRDFDTAPGYHNIIRGNVSYHNENKGPTFMYGGKLTDGNGLIYDTCRGQGATLIENNLCYDNGGRGIHAFMSDNITIRNNTVYKNGRTNGDAGIRAVGCNNVFIEKNIIVGRQGQIFDNDGQLGVNVAYKSNFIFGYQSVTDPPVLADPSNRIDIDPEFINATVDSATADFHLRSNSPAIGDGANGNTLLPQMKTDGHR
jgi:parallel beta-helix repeat protein